MFVVVVIFDVVSIVAVARVDVVTVRDAGVFDRIHGRLKLCKSCGS